MDENNTLLKKQWEFAKARRQPHENEISECYVYTFPSKEFYRRETQDQPVDRTRLFDTTATDATNNLVTQIMNLLVPQNEQWAGLDLREELMQMEEPPFDRDAVLRMLDASNKRVFETFSDTSFYLASGEAITDAVVAGTGCLSIYEDQDTGKITYTSIPTNQLYYTENAYGQPDSVFRCHKMTVRQIMERWDSVPEQIREDVQNKRQDRTYEILETETRKGDEWVYEIFLATSWHSLEKTVSDLRVYIVFRWDKIAGEVWGESPVRHALPAIRELNEFVKLQHSFAEYAAFGLWQVADESVDLRKLKGQLNPGSVIALDEPLNAVPFPGTFQVSDNMVEELRTQIRRLLLADMLPPHVPGTTPVSAAEIEARRAEFFQRVGQPALRLEREFLLPLLTVTIARLQKRGDLPVIPPKVIQAMGMRDIQTQDDLFRVVVRSAVKRIIRMTEAQQDLQAVAALTQTLGPEALPAFVDMEKFIPQILSDLGFRRDHMKSPEQREQEKKQQQQEAAMQQQLALAQTGQGMAQAEATRQETTAKTQQLNNSVN